MYVITVCFGLTENILDSFLREFIHFISETHIVDIKVQLVQFKS